MAIMTMASVVIACWYVVRFDGDPQPLTRSSSPFFTKFQRGIRSRRFCRTSTNQRPSTSCQASLGSDGLFEALRLDVKSGVRSSVRILFGPGSAYVPFESAEVVGNPTIELHGLSLGPPHLPSLEVSGRRRPWISPRRFRHRAWYMSSRERRLLLVPLLTRTIINSSSMLEMMVPPLVGPSAAFGGAVSPGSLTAGI